MGLSVRQILPLCYFGSTNQILPSWMLLQENKSQLIVCYFRKTSFRVSFWSRWHCSILKPHTSSAPPPSSLPKVALKTVPVFVWLNMDRSWPQRLNCCPLSFSTHLSFRQILMWCSSLSMFRMLLEPVGTSALPSCRPDMTSAVLASLCACSYPPTLAQPGQ